MPETLNWSFGVDITDGPRLSGSDTLTVGAYDKLNVTVPAGSTDTDVQLQPAETSGKVSVVVVRASAADPQVTLSADEGSTAFALDGPVVLIGAGAVRMLADPPTTLRLTNGTAEDVVVDVLVGRDPAP